MNKQKKKPSAWYFGLAGLALVMGCVIAGLIAFRTVPGLPGALESGVNIDDLTQVVVPGEAEIKFDEPGAYAVYYEYQSEVDGVRYAGTERPPALDCLMTGVHSGKQVRAVPDYVETNRYSTMRDERVGVLMMSLTVDRPDTYTFACRYANGNSDPQVVVAVGPNFVWEFLDVSARAGLSLLAGVVVFLASVLAAIVIVIVVGIRRQREPAGGSG